MKTSVAVTLVIMGGLLVAAPIVSDYLQRQQVVAAMSKPGVTSISLRPELSELYRFGCWLTGSAMIAAAIYYSRRSSGSPGQT